MKPVKTNRPMSEYEAALLWTVEALGQALLKSGNVSETALLDRLSELRNRALESDRTNEAAIYASLMKFWGEPPVYYAPGPNAPKPSN